LNPAPPAGSGEFFLIVDGQREEVLAGLHRLGGSHRAKHHGLTKSGDDRAVRLPRNAARFELEGLSAPLDFDCFRIEHFISFTRRPDAGGTAVADKPVCERFGAFECP
jgi:hypothetical protein